LQASGRLAKEAWDFTVDTMVKNGDRPRAVAYDDIVVPEFVAAAEKVLGPYRR
jgi:hypothetical protein